MSTCLSLLGIVLVYVFSISITTNSSSFHFWKCPGLDDNLYEVPKRIYLQQGGYELRLWRLGKSSVTKPRFDSQRGQGQGGIELLLKPTGW